MQKSGKRKESFLFPKILYHKDEKMKENGFADIVAYETIAGQKYPVGSIGKTDFRFRIQNTTEEECRGYAVLLEKAGYQKRAEKEKGIISAKNLKKTKKCVDKGKFARYNEKKNGER